jgi:hypothetical protein
MARRREMIQKRVIAGDDLARHNKEPAMACIKIVIRSVAPLGMMLIALPAMAATAPDLSAKDKVVQDLISRTKAVCAKDIRSDECGAYQRSLLVTVAALEAKENARAGKRRDVTQSQFDALLSVVDNAPVALDS